jgi:hypothetical protein
MEDAELLVDYHYETVNETEGICSKIRGWKRFAALSNVPGNKIMFKKVICIKFF